MSETAIIICLWIFVLLLVGTAHIWGFILERALWELFSWLCEKLP